jgi:hypothetical protein
VPRTALILLISLVPALASGEAARVVERSRLRVGDVVPTAPSEIAELDLGPSPAPGGSRVVARAEVEDKVRSAGYEPASLRIPAAVRLVGATRRIPQAELNELCQTALLKSLPAGITVVKANASRDLVVSPGATVLEAKVQRPPRQKGQFHTTAILEFQSDGEVVARAAIPVTLDVSERAAQPDIARGRRVTLVVDKRGIRVSTTGIVQTDANVGEIVQVQVASTGRVLKAEVKSSDEAEVIETP